MHKSLLSERRGLAIFSEKALMIAAALISLLLQIISFVTTWQGAEAYFSSAFLRWRCSLWCISPRTRYEGSPAREK